MKCRTLIAWTASLTAVVVAMALLWAFRGVLAAAPEAPAAPAAPVPGLISYQGQLSDPDTGDPVEDGAYQMTFSIYDVVTGGMPVWAQPAVPVPVEDGLFHVQIGPLGPEVFDGGPRWLGVKVGSGPEMRPRQPLNSVPYALRAETLRVGGRVSATSPVPIYTLVNGGDGSALRMVSEGSKPTLLAANNGSGPALMADGNAHVNGDLSWYTRTSYISVSPAEFQPFNETQSYNRTGRRLYPTGGDPWFYAPLQLPHGATVTKMEFQYFHDSLASNGAVTMTLRRGPVTGLGILGVDLYEDMAQVVSQDSGPSHYGLDHDDSIDHAIVDNEGHIYWLYAKFGGTLDANRKIMAVTIEYQYTEPY